MLTRWLAGSVPGIAKSRASALGVAALLRLVTPHHLLRTTMRTLPQGRLCSPLALGHVPLLSSAMGHCRCDSTLKHKSLSQRLRARPAFQRPYTSVAKHGNAATRSPLAFSGKPRHNSRSCQHNSSRDSCCEHHVVVPRKRCTRIVQLCMLHTPLGVVPRHGAEPPSYATRKPGVSLGTHDSQRCACTCCSNRERR